jgi:ketosteroid isomerase-like protein
MTQHGENAPMTREEILELAAAFMRAVQQGDAVALKSIYADDATIWHTFDCLDQPVEANIRGIAWFKKYIKGVRYEEIRVAAVDDGFVQQHVFRADVPTTEMPCMLRAWCSNGRITRLEEYLDSAHSVELVKYIAKVKELRRQEKAEAVAS